MLRFAESDKFCEWSVRQCLPAVARNKESCRQQEITILGIHMGPKTSVQMLKSNANSTTLHVLQLCLSLVDTTHFCVQRDIGHLYLQNAGQQLCPFYFQCC